MRTIRSLGRPRRPATAAGAVRLRPIDWIASAAALLVVIGFTSIVAIPAVADGPAGSAGATTVPRIVADDGVPAADFPPGVGPTDSPSPSPSGSVPEPPRRLPAGRPARRRHGHETQAPGGEPRADAATGRSPALLQRQPPEPHRPASAGATVRLGACVYHEAVTISKALTLQGPAVVEGDNKRSQGIAVRADGVTIDGLTVQHVNDPDLAGAIDVQGVSHFTLKNAIVRNSALICLAVKSSSSVQVLSTELASCGKEGFLVYGDHGVTFQNDRIHGNNAAGRYDTGWEAGGGKAGASSSLVFKGNRSYGNDGPGLWCDAGCSNVTFSGNRVYGNSRAGIMAEISSGITITGNDVWENGWGFTTWGWGAGILVSSSAAVTVSGNTVAWNADGISVVGQDRGNAANNDVHDVVVRANTIVMAHEPGDGSDVMGLAWLQDWNGVLFAGGSANGGSGNAYWWSAAAPHCAYDWNGCLSSLSDFNATPGEQGGVLLSSSTKAARLAAAGIPASPAHH